LTEEELETTEGEVDLLVPFLYLLVPFLELTGWDKEKMRTCPDIE
jgi:hypothetical protein